MMHALELKYERSSRKFPVLVQMRLVQMLMNICSSGPNPQRNIYSNSSPTAAATAAAGGINDKSSGAASY